MFLSFAEVADPVSLPDDFINQLRTQLTVEELGQFQNAIHQNPTLSIRANPLKKTELKNDGQVPWCSEGFYLNARPSFTLDPVIHAGGYYVQEASSMFLEQAVKGSLDINSPLTVLDLCAAPGGKSTHLLSLLNQQSLLVGNEVIRARSNILCENLQKWGAPNVVVTQNDPAHFNRLHGFFDLIVVDAPCSGEGLFRKERGAILEWSPSNVELCSQRQRRILSDIFPSLKQNGILIYCTCTYNRKENEENLAWLKQQKEVEFISIPLDDRWGIQETRSDGIIGYRFFPHRVQGEGFFISILRKLGKEGEVRVKNKEPYRTNAAILEKVRTWIYDPTEYAFQTVIENITLIPKKYQQEIEFLSQNLNVIQKGILIGSVKHEKVVPAHPLALSNVLNKENIASIELSKEDALRYLRKEIFHLPNQKIGFALMTYSGLGLGWANVLGNRVNNLYPVNWRIRMEAKKNNLIPGVRQL